MRNKPIGFVVGFLGCLLAASANAEPPSSTASGTKPELPTALTAADLAELSGGANPNTVAVSSQTLSAVNSGNTVNTNSLVTGDVTLQTGAFNGFNGVGNFVFNTGNNNNLQGSLSVTILTPQ